MGRAMAVVLVMFLAAPAAAQDDLEEGLAAYDQGDYGDALEAWNRAAARGEVAAMNAIAGLYGQGEGVGRDPLAAATWYRRSAERGDSIGQLNLGDLYGRGSGLPLDRARAYFWLSLAAAQGNAWAADRKKEIARTMTAAESAWAASRIAAWKPKTGIDPDSHGKR